MRENKILKNIHDLYPFVVITAGVFLSLFLVFVELDILSTISIFTLSLLMRHLIPLQQHHHAHDSIFNNKYFNFIYDIILMMGGGNTTPVWYLHHCIGHHSNYLDPRNDVEGYLRFGKEIPCQRMVFTILGVVLTIFDSYNILRKLNNKKLNNWFFLHLGLQAVFYAAFLILFPFETLVFIILPNLYLKMLVFWFNYGQHESLEGTNVYDSSITDFRFNYLFLNLGHHTAHHRKPKLHWSRLPVETDEILPYLPKHCIKGENFKFSYNDKSSSLTQ